MYRNSYANILSLSSIFLFYVTKIFYIGIFPIEDQCKSLVGYNELRLSGEYSLPKNRVIPVAPALPTWEPTDGRGYLNELSFLNIPVFPNHYQGLKLQVEGHPSLFSIGSNGKHSASRHMVHSLTGLEPPFLPITHRSRQMQGMGWDSLEPMGRKSTQKS